MMTSLKSLRELHIYFTMHLDAIYQHIGEFGVYQKVLYLLIGLVGIPTGLQHVAITFLGADMDHWCHVPQLSNLTHAQQKYIAIPIQTTNNKERYHQCKMYNLSYDAFRSEDFRNWNRSQMITNDTEIITCTSWVYDQSEFVSTIVNRFDLVCDRAFVVSLVQTVYMTGVLIGCVVFGQMSDRVGRKKALMWSLVLEIIFAVTAAFMPNIFVFMVFRFLVGVTAAGAFTTAFVVSMEAMGPKWRMETGIFYQGWFAVGLMLLSLISFLIRDVVKFQIVLAATIVPQTIAFFWIFPESPRWLISTSKTIKAKKQLALMAKINGTRLPENLVFYENKDHDGEGAVLTDLFKTPRLRIITLAMWFCWIATSVIYYGLSLGVSVLSSSIFLNNFLTGLVEMPAYLFTCLALNLIGRRWPLIVTFLLGGVFCLISIPFLHGDAEILLTTFLMGGKFFGAASFSILYVYAAELFPTVVRNVGVGSSSMCARIGGLVQPQIALVGNYWLPAPFIFYGVISVLGGLASLLFPETRNMDLPESLEDAENFGRRSKEDPKEQDRERCEMPIRGLHRRTQ